MRTLVVTTLVLCLALAPVVPAAAEERVVLPVRPVSLNRLMTFNDPNRDPNWDWTLNVTYDLTTTSQTFRGVRLPYYANAGPASVLNVAGDRDILSQDGWRLLLRDFGPNAVQAFFVLYNRHRGVMRVFYYHPSNQYSHAIGKVSFQQAQVAKSSPLFTLTDSTSRYVSNYGPERTAVAVGAMGQGWCYLDFDLGGYDPSLHLKDDPSLMIEITGVTESSLVLNGSINLTQRTATAQRNNSGGFNATDAVDAYKQVSQRYKDVEDARQRYEQMARQKTGSKFADFILNSIGGLASKKWLSALGPVAGVLGLVFGGGSGSERQPAPLLFDGELELKGNLTSQAPLYFILIRVPGSRHVDPINDALSNTLPLYDVPLGVFNLAAEPRYRLYHRQIITNRFENLWTGYTYAIGTDPVIVEANLHVFDVTAARVAYPIAEWLASYRDVGFANANTVSDVYESFSFADPRASNWFTGVAHSPLAVQLTLTPRGAPTGTEPVTVIKTYKPAKTLISGFPPTTSRTLARPSSLVAAASGSGAAELRWFDNAGDERGFVVEQREWPSGTWVQVASLPINTRTYTALGLVPGRTYEFRVRASGQISPSAYSNLARMTAS